MTEIIWIVNHFQGIYVLTHMRTEEDQMYFCLFFYVLLVTIENSPIPRPVFPSSSSGVLSEKEEQEENRLLAASTGPTQQTPAIISQRNSSFSKKNFFQFLSLLNFLGNQQLTNNQYTCVTKLCWLPFLQQIYAAVVWPQLHGTLTTCFSFFRKFTPFWRFSLEILHFLCMLMMTIT